MDGADPLITKAQEGDSAAFAALFRRHRGDVTRLVFRLLGAHHEVEDVVQDVFVHVFKSLPSFRGDARFSTWLYRLTVNVVRMHQRRKRSRPRLVEAPLVEPTESEVAHPTAPSRPDGDAERAERLRALHRVVAELSEKKRTVLVLHDFEGMSAKEIADVVGAPVLTVRTRLFYARKEVYAALSEDPATAAVIGVLGDELPGGRRGPSAAASHASRRAPRASGNGPEPATAPGNGTGTGTQGPERVPPRAAPGSGRSPAPRGRRQGDGRR